MQAEKKIGQMSPEMVTEKICRDKKHVFCGSYTAEARRKGSTAQGIHHLEASLHLHTSDEEPYNTL